jgi:glutaredoxin-related protein
MKHLATFTLHNHTITLHMDGSVTCATCSLSASVADVVPLMYKHFINTLVLDGAEIKRA